MKLGELINVIEPFQKYEVYSDSGVFISNPHYNSIYKAKVLNVYEAKVLNVYATKVGIIIIDVEMTPQKEKKED